MNHHLADQLFIDDTLQQLPAASIAVLALVEQGVSKTKIAEQLGISVASVYNVLKVV